MYKYGLILFFGITFFLFASSRALAQQQTFPAEPEIELPIISLITVTLMVPIEYDFYIHEPEMAEYSLIARIPGWEDRLQFDRDIQTLVGTPNRIGSTQLRMFMTDPNTGKFLGVSETVLTVVLPEYALPNSEWSIARQWNELLLQAIREDFARPTVHARNLFHLSAAMYDAWAVYEDEEAVSLYQADQFDDPDCAFRRANTFGMSASQIEAAQRKAISHTAYIVLWHRFHNSPSGDLPLYRFDAMMESLGYDANSGEIDRETASSSVLLGEQIGLCYIKAGNADGANESGEYANQFYEPINPPMVMSDSLAEQFPTPFPDDPFTDIYSDTNMIVTNTIILDDPNRWQPLSFDLFVGQSGVPQPDLVTEFVGAEWGHVKPFALDEAARIEYVRDGSTYLIHTDPGAPPYLDDEETADDYRWGFTLVPKWAAFLDPADGVMLDISPAVIGNNAIDAYPETLAGQRNFYSPEGGDTTSQGHAINPHTGEPYPSNIVNRADYARVIAEFWADGPDSETPPGHWFTLLNELNDHPDLIKRWGGDGDGDVMDDLEWDVRSHFVLGGTMHDVAVSVWGLKGYYDYVRPVSAVRYMGSQGQSSDPDADYYSEHGLAVEPGFAEVVLPADPLAGEHGEHVGKMKLYTWLGPDAIEDPETDVAGVGWILAENWWPYQRPTFVTPPFAGYVSGHSTFSRAAAEVLTFLTGDPYFPGGVGEFAAPKNEFLVFEEGPSEDVVLQWATYRDAADQSATSRIWGGIHPPADDMPGRLMGMEIGRNAFDHAATLFDLPTPSPTVPLPSPSARPSTTSTPTPSPLMISIVGSTHRSSEPDTIGENSWIRPALIVSIATLNLGAIIITRRR